MSSVRILAIVLATVAFALPSAANADVLVNGTFDTGSLSPWVQPAPGGSNWIISSTVVQSGGYSAEVVGNYQLKQTFTPIPDSTITMLSFWLDHPNPQVQSNAYIFYYSDNTFVQNTATTLGTAYTFFDATSLLNPAKSLSGLGFYGSSLGATYLDTITLSLSAPPPSPVSEAPTAVMLAGPLLALGLLRRRG